MAHIACDVDGTADAAPHQIQELLQSLRAAGHRVSILTGTGDDEVTQDIFTAKANYLNSLGCGSCWDDMTVLSDKDIPGTKATWCADNGVDIMIDNDKDNAKAIAAAGIPLVLVPWASRV